MSSPAEKNRVSSTSTELFFVALHTGVLGVGDIDLNCTQHSGFESGPFSF